MSALPCDLGVGCDEAGVCYAAAHNQPEQCPHYKPELTVRPNEIRDPHYHLEGNGSLTVCWADESGPHEKSFEGERAASLGFVLSTSDEDECQFVLRQIIRMREGV